MSALLGNEGPGIIGKLLHREREKAANVEKPGFSGTMKKNKRGQWYSVQERADRRMRRRTGMIGGTAIPGGLAPKVTSALVMGNRG